MNRINPLHILFFVMLILLITMFKLNSSKNELAIVGETYNETLVVSSKLKEFHKTYEDRKQIKKSLDRILKRSSLRKANITKKVSKSNIIISSESMNKIALNSLMGKVINGSYNVVSLKIKKLSDKKVSIRLEIKW